MNDDKDLLPVPPDYPGPHAFYAGSEGPWLAPLRAQLGIAVGSPDFREEDRLAIVARIGGKGIPSSADWSLLFERYHEGHGEEMTPVPWEEGGVLLRAATGQLRPGEQVPTAGYGEVAEAMRALADAKQEESA